MGEPNIKSFSFESNRDSILYGLEELSVDISWEDIKDASRISLEYDFKTNKGNVIIIPKDETQNMVPNSNNENENKNGQGV